MIETLWSALDFWQRFGVIVMAVLIPLGIAAELIDKRERIK